ncbi:MAG: hypothetical protein R3176_04925 [Woeseiaceae bacterium]|nr:hypothetical protein [Woeseiaceae bacterium]
MSMKSGLTLGIFTCLITAGCGANDAPAPVAEPDTSPPAVTYEPKPVEGRTTIKPTSPIRISYRIIGEPIVGQPLAVDLQFESTLGGKAFDVEYRINDTTALSLPEAQAKRVTIAPAASEKVAAQQVRVVPLREGRLFLNVAAEVETDAGTISSVTAVPIDVGAQARKPEANGVVTTDEQGELIRTLPGRTD